MIIDHLYEGILLKLTTQGKIKDISSKLLSLQSNDERALYVYELVKDLDCFPALNIVKKSDNVSTYYRNQGNKCFQLHENLKAWQFYNLALLHAPFNSSNYCYALSNRSIILLALKKFKECLVDIDKVLALEYPKELYDKLLKRKEMCKEALSKNYNKNEERPDFNEFMAMKSTKDPRYLCASSKLEVLFTEQFGRQVIAKEDINVGDVLVEEEPYLVVQLKSQFILSCSYCLSRNLNLYPCESCCYALYCSADCKDKAFKEYHAVECQLMATLFAMDFTKLELLALRTVIKARNDHNNWLELFKTISDAEVNMSNELRGHVKLDDKWIFDSKHYATIHTLESNIDKRSVSDIFQKSVTGAVFLKFLKEDTNFLQVDDKKLYETVVKTVAGMLLLHLMTSPTNMHGITSSMDTNGVFVKEVNLASAPYGYHSLLNHSCAPNVVRYNKLGSGRMSLIALRPIKKGMQLFDNYGAHHALEQRDARRANLKFQYKFDCICEACINDWPAYLSMGPSIHVPANLKSIKNSLISKGVIGDLEKGNSLTAKKVFKSLCSLCKNLEPYAPCVELLDCQEALKQCLAIFSGLLSDGNEILVPWTALPPKD
ncbi:PREDICTED: SET and MYND domain-containing protein 4-like [Papilio polytes]|uniref:SET and MYND domain-containing protein 4-like n=1 Tax=Papilio polytes TaxID=76194 RepID=UPI000675C2A8|nr:PREDICTED: SET and MYND domain-containing protein 4-like [Papilio polytes]